jgi:epoxyqueuosine reductase
VTVPLKQAILNEAHRLGFILAGVTTPEPPLHFSTFENWLAQGHHADMVYLATERSRARRADPKQILPECKSILILGTPYDRPPAALSGESKANAVEVQVRGRIASYAIGGDYHLILLPRLQTLIAFIEAQVGHSIPNRYYTDSGPLLERDLAQRAGLGWIGKNTCLIHPRTGSYFLLAEILLGLNLDPNPPFEADYCGTCTRCLDACPTDCILPDRTLDARRCISTLTIENKGNIPADLRPRMQDWIFGCDLCQQACPWNKFAAPEGDPSFRPFDFAQGKPSSGSPFPDLIQLLESTPSTFHRQFKHSPIQRAKRRGLLRNAAVALGNIGDEGALATLDRASGDSEPLVQEHAQWAKEQIKNRKSKMTQLLLATTNQGKIRELRAILAGLPLEVITPADIGLNLDVAEDGSTYAENAAQKALAFARASGLTALADDSGLEVDALDGAPGLYSARYLSKPSASDADRRAFLLQNLDGKPRPWTAHFRATVAIASPAGGVESAEGTCPGEIIPEERGNGGFGYDPIFLLPELGLTMAELPEKTKNCLSHRARAVQAAKPILMLLTDSHL